MNKSFAISPFTMPAALGAADSILGHPAWEGDLANEEQRTWLESFRRRADIADGMPEIRKHASKSAGEHVAWLKAEGWSAQIAQGGPNDLFLAATLNIVAKWQEAGRAYQEAGIDRVLLKKGVYTSSIAQPHDPPVVEVVTQHPSFSFCFQEVADAPRTCDALAARAIDMVTRKASKAVQFDFPMVDLLIRDDARHMIGLRAGENVVTQAAEQLRLELNEVGGRASAAAEVAVTRSTGPATIKITGPFVVAINRSGAPCDADKVVFAAFVDRAAWKRPTVGRIL